MYGDGGFYFLQPVNNGYGDVGHTAATKVFGENKAKAHQEWAQAHPAANEVISKGKRIIKANEELAQTESVAAQMEAGLLRGTEKTTAMDFYRDNKMLVWLVGGVLGFYLLRK